MKEMGLFCRTIRKFRATSNQKIYELGENLLSREFHQSTLDTIWVTDITYIHVRDKFCYLATVIDLASRKPIGWYFSEEMTANTALTAVKYALQNRNFPKNVIIHSDRGSQYTSKEFRDFVALHEMKQSFSKKGCPYDNAVIESFHSSLKKEMVYRTTFSTFEQARLALFKYIEYFYTKVRLHSAIGYLTPQQMEDKITSESSTRGEKISAMAIALAV